MNKRDKTHYVTTEGIPMCKTKGNFPTTKEITEVTCGNCKKFLPTVIEYETYKDWKIMDAPGWMFCGINPIQKIDGSRLTITACTVDQLKTMIDIETKKLARAQTKKKKFEVSFNTG